MRRRPGSFGFTILLGALAALPPLSIDMGLPAFPALERGLGTSAAGAGLTLSAFQAGFAAAQLVFGPLADRIGRRPVLLGGLALYALAGLLCAAAPSIGALLALRLVQGACAASGPVMALAIVRDLFTGAAARTRLSYVAVVLSVAPIIAPAIGSVTLLLAGWRGSYGFLGVTGALLTLAAVLGVRETRVVRAPPRVLAGFARMLRHRSAIAFALTNALSFGAMFAYISGSPLVLMGAFGLSAPVFALLFALTSAGILVGAWVNGRLASRAVAPRLPLLLALLAALLWTSGLLLLFALGVRSLGAIVPLLVAFSFTRGIIAPTATHGAMEPMGEIAGLASSVVGFSQMAMAALSSGLVAVLFPLLGPVAMPLTMTGFAATALLVWRFGDLASGRGAPAAPVRGH